jgi:hypothetical protein
MRIFFDLVAVSWVSVSIADAFGVVDGSRRLGRSATTTSSGVVPCYENDTSLAMRVSESSSSRLTQLNDVSSRRSWLVQTTLASAANTVALLGTTFFAQSASADFTPGGTLVDRAIGVTVGNPEASVSRKPDNSNVLFDKDYYFKFGTAPAWIEPDSTEFPKTMPFTKSQQRYDALNKYKGRILSGFETMKSLEKKPAAEIEDPTAADVYQLRPMGLLANGFLASENTGTPNELFLARWYINEIYLQIGDMRNTDDPATRQQLYGALKKAVNSYVTMLNRVITAKVGDKFEYV